MLCIIFPRIVDHTSTRARAHRHTHTHTHTVVAQPRGTHFLRLTQKLRRKRQSRGKQIKKKKKKVRKNLLFRLQNERDTVIYTRYMEKEMKRRNEREREKIKKKEREEKAHRMNIESRTPQILTNQSMSNWVDY